MPFIQAQLSISVDNKDELQQKLMNAVSDAFSKPTTYIMTQINDNCDLWMGGKKIDKGAYLAISLLGNTNKNACATLTQEICKILKTDYNIDGQNIYITYHPTELWGWNGMMF